MQLTQFPRAVDVFGMGGAMKLFTSRRKLRRVLPEWTQHVQVRGYAFPFHFRHATTDKYIIVEVLQNLQYACLRGIEGVRTIVDAGANIGTASVFLLNAYPHATVIALEPDPGNFEVLARNLSYYGPRAIAVRQALWHRAESLTLDRGHFRDGGEWTFQVRPATAGEAVEVEGATFSDLSRRFKLQTVDILKVDIEGAEREVFAQAPPESWKAVRTLAVELHDESCRAAFSRAMSSLQGQVSQHGEVTLWQRT